MGTAERLLDAHVAFVLRRLQGDQLARTIEDELDHLLAAAGRLTLDEVVDRSAVRDVAVKYASRFALPGAIPEVVGDIATRVREHPANATPVGEILARRHVEALARKVAELRPLRQRIVTLIAESPVVQAWLADYLRSLATGPIAANRRLVGRLPGVSRAMSMGERLADPVLREADQRSRELAERTAASILRQWADGAAEALEDAELVEAVLGAWDGVADRPVGDVLEGTNEDDLVDFVVIAFELWLELRDTPYLQSLIGTGVDYFFDTYGGFTLDGLLEEFGLTRADLVEEALRFAPKALDAALASGELEALVRRQLAAFYESPEARAALIHAVPDAEAE